MKFRRIAALLTAMVMLVVSVAVLNGCDSDETPSDPYEYVEKLVEQGDNPFALDVEKSVCFSVKLPENDVLKSLLKIGGIDIRMISSVDGLVNVIADLDLPDNPIHAKGYLNQSAAAFSLASLGDATYGVDLTHLSENLKDSVFTNPESAAYLGEGTLPAEGFKVPDIYEKTDKYEEQLEALVKSAAKAEMADREAGGYAATFTLDNAGVEKICRGVYQIIKDDADLTAYIKQIVKPYSALVSVSAVPFDFEGMDAVEDELPIEADESWVPQFDIDSFFTSEEQLNALIAKMNEQTVLVTFRVEGDGDDSLVGCKFGVSITDKDNNKKTWEVDFVRSGSNYGLEITIDADGTAEKIKLSAVAADDAGDVYNAVLSNTVNVDGKEVTSEILTASVDKKAKSFTLSFPVSSASQDEADDAGDEGASVVSMLGAVSVNGTYDFSENRIQLTIAELDMGIFKAPLNAVIEISGDPAGVALTDVPSDFVEITKLSEAEAVSLLEAVSSLLGERGEQKDVTVTDDLHIEEDWDPIVFSYNNPQDDGTDVTLEVNDATSRCAITTSTIVAGEPDGEAAIFLISREYASFTANGDNSITVNGPEYLSRELCVCAADTDVYDAICESYRQKLNSQLEDGLIDADFCAAGMAMIDGEVVYFDDLEADQFTVLLNYEDYTFTLAA